MTIEKLLAAEDMLQPGTYTPEGEGMDKKAQPDPAAAGQFYGKLKALSPG